MAASIGLFGILLLIVELTSVSGMTACGESSCWCFDGAGKHIIYCHAPGLTEIPLIPEENGKYAARAQQFWLEENTLEEVTADRVSQEVFPNMESFYVRRNPDLDCESLRPLYDFGWHVVTDCPEPTEDIAVTEGTELHEDLPGMLVELHGYGVDVTGTKFMNESYTTETVEEYRNWEGVVIGLIAIGVIVAVAVVAAIIAGIVFVRWKKQDNIQSADVMRVVMAAHRN